MPSACQGPRLPRPHWPLCSSLTALLFCSQVRTTVLLVLLLSQLFTPPLGRLQTHTPPRREASLSTPPTVAPVTVSSVVFRPVVSALAWRVSEMLTQGLSP